METWKEKHERILKNKDDIIKEFKDGISIEKIAKIYRVSGGCISNNLRLWDIRNKHGIKYLLGKCYEKQ